jgi:DNA repair protein RadC
MYRTIEMSIPMVQDPEGPAAHSAADVHAACRDLEGLAQEAFHVLTLNQKNRVIHRHMVALGSLTEALVHPREVFRPALLDSAAAVVLVHNHPSGDPAPSRADRQLTERMKTAADILGIRLVDHIVIGKDRYYSFAESGALRDYRGKSCDFLRLSRITVGELPRHAAERGRP